MKPKLTFPWRILLVAIIIRLIPVLMTRSLGIGLDDMFQYDMLARSLASGNGFRWYAYEDLQQLEPYVDFDLSSLDYDPERGVLTSFRAPLYPSFLALTYYLTGIGVGRFFAARLVQAVIGAMLAPLTYLVSRRLFPADRSASVIAAWVIACYPLLVIYPIALATENLFFLLVLTSFFFLLKTKDEPKIINFIFSGLFLALASLTRSAILLFAGMAILWAWFVVKHKRGAFVIALMLVTMVTPWVLRNSLLHQKLTGVESSLGYNLYVSYHPESNGSFTFGPSLELLSILDDAERDRLGTEKAVEFILADPGRFVPLAINRLGFFFGLEKRALVYFYSNDLLGYIPLQYLLTISGILLLPFVVISTSSVLGFARTRVRPGILLLYLLFFSYVLPHVVILAEDRFHLAIIPFLAILAAKAWSGRIQGLVAQWKESNIGKFAVSLAVLAILLLFVNWGLELFRDADKIVALLGSNGNQTYFPY